MRALAIAAVVAQAGIAVTGSVVRVTGSGPGLPDLAGVLPGQPGADPAPRGRRAHPVDRVRQPAAHRGRGAGGRAVLPGRAEHPPAPGPADPAGADPAGRRGGAGRARRDDGAARPGLVVGGRALRGRRWSWCGWPCSWSRRRPRATARRGRWSLRAVRRLVGLSTVVLAALLVAGTLVTAAGPHAGDAATPRLDVGVPVVAQLHADLLFGYLGLLVGLGFALAAVHAPARLWRRYRALLAVVLGPGRARRRAVRAGGARGAGLAARAGGRAGHGGRGGAVGRRPSSARPPPADGAGPTPRLRD